MSFVTSPGHNKFRREFQSPPDPLRGSRGRKRTEKNTNKNGSLESACASFASSNYCEFGQILMAYFVLLLDGLDAVANRLGD